MIVFVMPCFRLAMYTVVEKTQPPIHMTVFSTNVDRSIIFGIQCTEVICKFCNITVIDLLTSSTYGAY